MITLKVDFCDYQSRVLNGLFDPIRSIGCLNDFMNYFMIDVLRLLKIIFLVYFPLMRVNNFSKCV